MFIFIYIYIFDGMQKRSEVFGVNNRLIRILTHGFGQQRSIHPEFKAQ